MIKLLSFISYIRSIGIFNTIDYIMQRYLSKKDVIAVKVKGIKSKIFLRKHSKDINVFQQIFIKKDLNFLKGKSPKIIIDAGANIGLSTIFMKSLFPEAMIFSIEPETANFEMLLKNIKAYNKVTAIPKALSDNDDGLYLVDIGKGSDAFQTKKFNENSNAVVKIESITISSLMKQYNLIHLDVVKIDIEGAEKDCLNEKAINWINVTSLLAVEIHEHLAPGSFLQIKSLLKKFDYSQHGEYTVFEGSHLKKRTS